MGARVLVLCADIGEGHLSTARALSTSLREHSAVDVVEVRTDMSVMGQRLGDFLGRGFRTHLQRLGWTYDAAYLVFFEHELPRRAGHLALTLLGGRGLLQTISGFQADVVVVNYPLFSAALGELRRMGRLPIPVCSSISDPAGLYYWAHPGIDLHVLNWPESVAEVERIAGAGKSVVVRPPLQPRYLEPLDQREARLRLELPLDQPVVVVSGGGWGIGDLPGAARVARQLTPETTVVALAGRSESVRAALAAAFSDDPRVHVLGFTERMPELLMAADVLVHTTGGATALEARVVGCPLINFGTGPAHVRAHARALAQLELAQWAPRRDALAPALRNALSWGRHAPMRLAELPDAADVVVGLVGR